MKKETKEGTATKLDNSLYCPQYAGYLWNNWTGLASLWTDGFGLFMNEYLKDQAQHSQKKATQPAFTCSKLTIETLRQGVKYVQSQQ